MSEDKRVACVPQSVKDDSILVRLNVIYNDISRIAGHVDAIAASVGITAPPKDKNNDPCLSNLLAICVELSAMTNNIITRLADIRDLLGNWADPE